MSGLFGIGGSAGLGGLNGFDCMVKQSDRDRQILKEQCEAAINAGVNSDAIILELSTSADFNSLMDNDKEQLIKEIEKMDKMRKR